MAQRFAGEAGAAADLGHPSRPSGTMSPWYGPEGRVGALGGRTVRTAGVLVAVDVVVLDALPDTFGVHVGDDLLQLALARNLTGSLHAAHVAVLPASM